MIFNLVPKSAAGGLPEKAALSAMSWEDISAVSQAGLAVEYWSVGDASGTAGDGYVENSWEGEGSQYPYYATAANRKKTQSGAAISWWTRSLAAYTAEFFCTFSKTGAAATGEANGTAGVSFGFCV